MAMKIEGEYSAEQATARKIEQPAEEAGLGKPLVRARVAEPIRRRSEKVGDGFRK